MNCNICYGDGYSYDCCYDMCVIGHLDCLKLHTSCAWCPFACEAAAHNGHLDCLRYAHEQGYIWSGRVCYIAALNGHLDCLRYAHEQGCPWGNWTCYDAAKHGHLDCLRYAHEHGCSWDRYNWICEIAAKKGYVECLKYAHEQGCPWNHMTCEIAAIHGHSNCLIYLYKNRCPDYSSYYLYIKNELLKSNIAFFLISLRLKLYAIRFRKRFYSIDSKGFLSAKNHFSKITYK